MAVVFKSILVAAAVLLVGFGAAGASAKAVKERPSRFGGCCGNRWVKRHYVATERPCPALPEHYGIDVRKKRVPRRWRRLQYPRRYTTGYVSGGGLPLSGANVGQIGDFWAGMNRSTRPPGGR